MRGGIIFFYGNRRRRQDFTPGAHLAPVSRFRRRGRLPKILDRHSALPYLEERFGAPMEPENRALLGYSLGGLFALWALTKTENSVQVQAFPALCGTLQFLKYLENCPPKKGHRNILIPRRPRTAWRPARHADGGRLHGNGEGDFKRSRLQGILRVESRRARQGRHQTLAARRAQTFLTMMAKNGGKVRQNAVLIVNDGGKRRGAKRNARADRAGRLFLRKAD